MGFLNTTRNQHFISRAELRLNATDRSTAKRNPRIYSLVVQDREAWRLKLERSRGTRIGSTLSHADLFSFDVLDERRRANLEETFQRYEETIAEQSKTLHEMVAAGEQTRIKEVLENLFIAKFLNFLRSPFCVRKVLSTIGRADEYLPTDPGLAAAYSHVLHGSRPHQERVCAAYGLESEEYEKWLRCLFVLLAVEVQGRGSILDVVLGELFATSAWGAGVYSYIGAPDGQVCLLSDRGFNTPANDRGQLIIEFNIAARIFTSYCFLDVSELLPEAVQRHGITTLISGIDPAIWLVDRDLDALAQYNRRTLYQCKQRVYSASARPYGVSVD